MLLRSNMGGVSSAARVGLCIAGLLALAWPARAQGDEEHSVTLSASGGFTMVTGSNAGKLDHGGAFHAGLGHFFNDYFGITGNFMFDGLGITRNELNNLGQPDGNARVYTFTVD